MQQDSEFKNWSVFKKIIFRFVFVYILIFINSFSFPHNFIPDIGKYTSPLFEILVKWFGGSVLKIDHTYTSELISDSTGMYIHVFLFVFISGLVCLIWTLLDRKQENYIRLFYWFIVIVSYYLAMQLFTYGFSKIFKWQFYLPEPNTLFTTLGNTPRDLLYWSTMGSSRPFVLFIGLIEITAASLLLFKRTRLLGSLLAIGILVNVVIVNFCFDISVKLYSCFLLLLGIIIVAPDVKRLFSFFILNRVSPNKLWKPDYLSNKTKMVYRVSKTLVICLIVSDALGMYFASTNFNDDKAKRPMFHGAYQVELFVKNNDSLAPLLNDAVRWKRMFIHRRGYLITQSMNDEMQDYKLEYDTLNHQLIIENTNDESRSTLKYALLNDSTFVLNGKLKNDSINVRFKKADLTKLPLLQNEFNWTIDE